jgi:hypothetical protein
MNNDPYVFIGYFDCIIIVILVLLNIYFCKKSLTTTVGCVISGVLFGFILPAISMKIEIDRINAMDAYELLYTYFRFPLYWIMGTIQLIIFGLKKTNTVALTSKEDEVQ